MGGTRRGNGISLGEDLKSQHTGRHLWGVGDGPDRREAEARASSSHLFRLWVGACAATAAFFCGDPWEQICSHEQVTVMPATCPRRRRWPGTALASATHTDTVITRVFSVLYLFHLYFFPI